MTTWYNLYITDKTNKEMFRNTCTEWGLMSSKRDLQMHINQAKQYPDMYKFLDIDTAEIKIEENK